MIVTIRRFDIRPEATFGEILLNGDFECYSQEPPIRADRVFIPGEAALPSGFYNISLAPSQRHKMILPLLASCRPRLDTGDPAEERRLVRIGMWVHPGRAMLDHDGLLVVGQLFEGRMVTKTRPAFESLFAQLAGCVQRGEAIDCEIRS